MKVTEVSTEIIKLSTNLYFGAHYRKKTSMRNNMRDLFYLSNPDFERIDARDAQVIWEFHLPPPLLDVSNCSSMIKILEDIMFVEDTPKQVSEVIIRVRNALDSTPVGSKLIPRAFITVIEK